MKKTLILQRLEKMFFDPYYHLPERFAPELHELGYIHHISESPKRSFSILDPPYFISDLGMCKYLHWKRDYYFVTKKLSQMIDKQKCHLRNADAPILLDLGYIEWVPEDLEDWKLPYEVSLFRVTEKGKEAYRKRPKKRR